MRKWLEDRLRDLRPQGKSKSGLAKILGAAPARVTELIQGDRSISSHEVLKVAQYLEWTLEEFYRHEAPGARHLNVLPPDRVKVPLISWIHASAWADITTPYTPGQSETEGEIEVPYEGRVTLIAFKVRGTSINRVAPEGSVILVDYADKEPVKERFYVIQRGGEACCKRYMPAPARFEPFSTDHHETIYPDGDTQVVGRVVKVVTEL